MFEGYTGCRCVECIGNHNHRGHWPTTTTPPARHLAVPYAADDRGQPASYRCVRCTAHWSAGTRAPATCQTTTKENSTP